MKPLLPLLLLFMSASTLQAQKVLVTDSSVYNTNYFPSSYYQAAGVNTHIVNGFCKDSIVVSPLPRQKTFYNYNSLQQRTSELLQARSSDNDSFRNLSRTLYTYTPTGKRDTLTLQFESYYKSGILRNDMQTVSLYDANDNLQKLLIYYWDATYMKWYYWGNNVYFNDSQGRLDSMYFTNNSADTTLVTYSYYPTGKLHQSVWYDVDEGRQFDFMSTRYYDSTAYISRDSMVDETYALNSDSLFVDEIISNTHYYSTDGTEQELHEYHYLGDSDTYIVDLYKTYYFYGNCSSVLPVSLLSFSAVEQNNNALLHWKTGDERNAAFYLVQRSTDGVHFTTLGSVTALGSGNSHLYTYTDINARLLSAPKLYYRLAETDKSGSVQYSDIVQLSLTAMKGVITLTSNPVKNAIGIRSSVAISNASIAVSDMQGKRVYSARRSFAEGGTIMIDASPLAKGMYLVTVQSALYKETLKVIKE